MILVLILISIYLILKATKYALIYTWSGLLHFLFYMVLLSYITIPTLALYLGD